MSENKSDGSKPSSKKSRLPGSLQRHTKTGGWYVVLSENGKQRWVACVPKGRKTATKSRAIAEQCHRRMFSGQEIAEAHPMDKWIDQFQTWNGIKSKARTAKDNKRVAKAFVAHQSIADPWDITPEKILAYTQSLKAAPGTVAKHHAAISKFCRYLQAKGQLDMNPARHELVELPTVYKRPPRFLTWPQVKLLFRRVKGTPLELPCRLALRTGLRIGELAVLEHSHIIRTADGYGVVVGYDDPNKTYESRTVRLPASVYRMIGKGEGLIFKKRGVRRWVRMLKEATEGLPVFGSLKGRCAGNRWHLLRSTFAVNQARRKVGIWSLMQMMGHRQASTTMRYVNLVRADE